MSKGKVIRHRGLSSPALDATGMSIFSYHFGMLTASDIVWDPLSYKGHQPTVLLKLPRCGSTDCSGFPTRSANRTPRMGS